MPPLAILILSDDRPGHYHLAEGVAAAISRRRPVSVTTVVLNRRSVAPGRLLAAAVLLGVAPNAVLRGGYELKKKLPAAVDLVISAGGDTLAANVASARLYRAPNIFCGTLRHLPAEAFSLVISSYARHAGLARHLVSLKPNGIDPDTLPRHARTGPLATNEVPKTAGLLIGGPSGLFRWRDDEWQRLAAFVCESWRSHRTRWIVSSSRRTPDWVGDHFAELAAKRSGAIAEFIDFRTAGPGTLARLFAEAEAVLATEDSSSMMSEAVCARLPVVGVAPEQHAFKDEEREYRALLTEQNWARSIPLTALSPTTFLAALGEIRPLTENHLDRLAAALAERLPDLFLDRRPAAAAD